MEERPEQFIEIIEKCDLVFKEALDEAKRRYGLNVSELTSVYLLNLIVKGWRAERPIEYWGEQTVAEQFANRKFRDAGDKALLITGIWRETIILKPVKIGYYISLGSMAYKNESESVCGLFSDLFKELSSGFFRMAEILRRAVNHLPKAKVSNQYIIKIYGEWLETRNPSLIAELVSLGIVPNSIKTTIQ